MYDGRGIANLILDHCDERGLELTNLKIQKILYFCHAWFLVSRATPLIKQNFEAWEYGPVLPYLYRELSHYKNQPIKGRIKGYNPATNKIEQIYPDITDDHKESLRAVAEIYARYSTSQLIEMSHVANGPWWNTWNHTGQLNPGMRISNEEILKFYTVYRPSFTH